MSKSRNKYVPHIGRKQLLKAGLNIDPAVFKRQEQTDGLRVALKKAKGGRK